MYQNVSLNRQRSVYSKNFTSMSNSSYANNEKHHIYKNIQLEVQKLFGQKQQSMSQLNENVLVKGEMDLLDGEDVKIYKLVGPVLLVVDTEEARDNVQKRIEFIEKGKIQYDYRLL